MDPQKRQALVLLIGSIFDQIDEIAILKKKGHKAHISIELLREMTSVIHQLPEDLTEAYLDFLVRIGANRSAPTVSSISDEYIELTKEKRKNWVESVKRELIAA